MRITILMGSPNKSGSTSILVNEFKKGAEESNHSVEVIDVCHANIHPCIGCVACGYEGPCVQKDDVEEIRQKLLSSDMVVFATPLYYYGMSAQLKTVVDRFCAYTASQVDYPPVYREVSVHQILQVVPVGFHHHFCHFHPVFFPDFHQEEHPVCRHLRKLRE